jgi:aldose 1-epimerase
MRVIASVIAACLVAACSSRSSEPMTSKPSAGSSRSAFGTSSDGQPIELVTLRNGNGMEVRAMTYGAIIVSIKVPDRQGQFDDVVLGHDDAAGYFNNPPYFGAVVGRYGNRIAKGKFSLDGHTYTLATNNGANHLHGGNKGWDKAIWRAATSDESRGASATFSHTSPDGDEGYPGTVNATVTYTLNDQNELRIDYGATTDKPTVINLTQHSYFNLAGPRASNILEHRMMIVADRYTPVDDGLIPTGELASVQGTPFDFRQSTPIGARIDQQDTQLVRGKGYDHNFVLNRTADGLALAARVVDPVTGRTLEVLTTEPGVQFYSGNFLDGTLAGKGGVKYARRAGFCLETQHFPDSPNHPNFPSTALRPAETYKTSTVFRFGVDK